MQQIGPYVVERELGRGGMGVVYVAYHPQLGRRVAIKRLLEQGAGDEVLARFQREAQALARLRHPGIVSVHEFGQVQGDPWMAMDLVVGESLEARLKRDGPLPGEEAAALLETLCEAMGYAHGQGFLHRDLKPENVLLRREDGRALITDFGLARDESAKERLTRTGEVLGTPAYMAPEQADGDPSAVDPRADVYGLGATLYAAVTGKPPIQGATLVNILSNLLTKPVTPPSAHAPDLDENLETVILKCLEKQADDRYPSAEALRADLERYRRGDPVSAVRPGFGQRLQRALRRRPLMAAVSGLATASLLGLLAVAVSQLPKIRELLQTSVASSDDGPQPSKWEQRQREREEARRLKAAKDEKGRIEVAEHLANSVTPIHDGASAERAARLLKPSWEEVEDLPANDPVRRLLAKPYAKARFFICIATDMRSEAQREELMAILEIDPANVPALRRLVARAVDATPRDWEGALRHADLALKLGGPHALTSSRRARALAGLGRQKEALAAAQDAIDADNARVAREGGSPRLLIREVKASILQQQGRWQEAKDAYDYALTDTEPYHTTFFARGECLMELGEFEAAREDMERAVRIKRQSGGEFWRAHCGLARLAEQEGNLDEAYRILEGILREDGVNAQALLLRATLRNKHGDPRGALADVRQALGYLSAKVSNHSAIPELRRLQAQLEARLGKAQ